MPSIADLGTSHSFLCLDQAILVNSGNAQKLIKSGKITKDELKWHTTCLAAFRDNRAYKDSPLKKIVEAIDQALLRYALKVDRLSAMYYQSTAKTDTLSKSIVINPHPIPEQQQQQQQQQLLTYDPKYDLLNKTENERVGEKKEGEWDIVDDKESNQNSKKEPNEGWCSIS